LLLAAGALVSASAGIAVEGIFGGDARIHGAEFWAERAPFDFKVFLVAAFGWVAVLAIAASLDGRRDTQRRPATLALIHVAVAFVLPGAWLLLVAPPWRGYGAAEHMTAAVLGFGALSAVLNLPCTAALYWAARLRR